MNRWFAICGMAMLCFLGMRPVVHGEGGADPGVRPAQPAEGGREANPDRGRRGAREGFQPADRERFQQIMEKRRRGEALTAEEEELAKRIQQWRDAQGRGGAEGRGGDWRAAMARRMQQRSPFVRVKMNPLDATYQAMAEAYYAAQKYVEAADSLKFIAENSPDGDAKNAARFNRALVYRRGLGYTSHAAAEYLQVKGILKSRALQEVVDMFQEANEMDQAVNTLSELAKATTEVGDKVEVLRTLAQAYTRSEKYDQAIETLKQIPQLIDYHKAVQMKDYYTEGDPEDVLTGRQPNMMFQFPMMGGMGMGPQPQRGGPGGEMPPPPPGERRPDQPREGAPARDPGATRDAAPANPAPLRQEPANPHHNQ